jgi:hypothetical protein
MERKALIYNAMLDRCVYRACGPLHIVFERAAITTQPKHLLRGFPHKWITKRNGVVPKIL